jgi:hypothetical protein
VKTQSTEYRLAIEPGGTVAGLPASDFTTPAALGRLLADNPLCQRCVVKQLFRYASGRQEEEADQDAIDAALARFRGSNFSFRELIIAVASSKPFLDGADGGTSP